MGTPNGGFKVADICYAGMAPQSQTRRLAKEDLEELHLADVCGMCSVCFLLTLTKAAADVSSQEDSPTDEWIGVVSGLNVSASSPPDAQIQMLVEYLVGEQGGPEDQAATSRISRLIIAGNSMVSMNIPRTCEVNAEGDIKKTVRFQFFLLHCLLTGICHPQ